MILGKFGFYYEIFISCFCMRNIERIFADKVKQARHSFT